MRRNKHRTNAEIFERAALEIERVGLKKGVGLQGGGSVVNGPCCAVVAIDRCVRFYIQGLKHRDSLPALAVLGRALGVERTDSPVDLVMGISVWNDAPERTAHDVINVMRGLALVERMIVP